MNILLGAPFPYRLVSPLGLGYLAVALRRAGHEVEIRNPNKGQDDPGGFARWCRQRNFDVVGFQVMTSERGFTRALLSAVHEELPNALLLVGGPHISGRGADALEDFEDAHYAFCGEAEESLPELLRLIDRTHRPAPGKTLVHVPGLVYRTDEGIQKNPPVLIEDIDSLGPLPWDLFDIEGYNEDPGIMNDEYPWYWIGTSRGCPHACAYCMNPVLNQGRIRYYKPQYVVDEIERMKKLGVPAVTLIDDTPTDDRGHFTEFCLELQRRVGIPWDVAGNATRLQTLDEELLQLMERTGCRKVAVALESGSAKMIQRFRRDYDPWTAVARINELAASTRMGFEVFFMLGHPDETDADVLQTIRAILALEVDRIKVNMFSPWPGIAITKELERQGRLPYVPDYLYYFDSAAMPTSTISVRRLMFYQFLYYALFNLKPKRAYNLVRQFGIGNVLLTSTKLLLSAMGIERAVPGYMYKREYQASPHRQNGENRGK
ncbi:MAG: radical SAM protein [Deltaproteobacteria bacterium]|nr:radical SAM protein [Deltaproteobacteria bacterium]